MWNRVLVHESEEQAGGVKKGKGAQKTSKKRRKLTKEAENQKMSRDE